MAHRVMEPFYNPGIPLLSHEVHSEKKTANQDNRTVGILLGPVMAIKFCICAKTPFLPSASPCSRVNLELQEDGSVS